MIRAIRPGSSKAWAAPRTMHPDAMAKNKAAPKFQPVPDKHTLSDGKRSVDIYSMRGLSHTEAMLMVHLPTEKVLEFCRDEHIATGIDLSEFHIAVMMAAEVFPAS